ncbi:MFS transporter [Sulfitobacter sp. D35]|uniref:MFS transporter n=1 Tax=Sulfitobacter sp. D35 TaxID=3083252 RepID=UPI00296F978E|nr:MFS transporter [Sulfitobacter sp. D35]MDW4497876.1 MFS transporter [Sulfitobacter sp. D35]
MSTTTTPPETTTAPGPWSPFRHAPFSVLWIATVISNVGTWMNDVGAGWLMTELSPSPFIVAAVQAATTLPIFLFALLAGAIADIVDRRRMLLVVNVMLCILATGVSFVVAIGAITPALLLVFTFLFGTGAAFMAPAWQAVVPKLVPRPELPSAIALNSLGVNISRAIGPALAGFLIVGLGIWSPFALNAASILVIIAALLWWRPPGDGERRLPPEHVTGAIRAGLRYAINSAPLKATLIRAGAFFLFASAYWAMLPLIAKDVLQGGPSLYGVLLASVGAGAVGGAIVLPKIRKKLGPNRTVAAGTIGTALVLVAFALVPDQAVAAIASAVAGFSWIAVLSSMNVSAQTALPDWVRARGLSVFLTVFFGSMSIGALIWGQVASIAGIPTALLIAATGIIIMIPLSCRAKLSQGESLDLTPSGHWSAPIVNIDAPTDRGPVMLQIAYEIAAEDEAAFQAAMDRLAHARKRNGGYGWTILQDTEEPRRFVETWFEASWTDHLRHHERVSEEDRAIQDEVHALHRGSETPRARHFLQPSKKEADT